LVRKIPKGANAIKGAMGYKVKILSKNCIWHMDIYVGQFFWFLDFSYPIYSCVLNIITFYYILVYIIYIYNASTL
jgi:hypothetical protein